MKKGRYGFFPFLLIAYAAVFILFPIIVEPKLLLVRGNDLQEQFWPVFYFIKEQALRNHELPLWNNLWFSGMPLLPDPQFPIFYPLHFVFLILPIDYAFMVSFILHIFLAGVGAYLLARHGLGLSNLASLFSSLLYMASPKLAGFLEAGHPGLVWSWAFLPFIALGAIKLVQKPKFVWAALLGLGLVGTFYTHTIIFIWSLVSETILFILSLILYSHKRADRFRLLLFFFLAGILTFGLTAIALLPQIEWAPQTTRFLLLQDRDVYPKWTGVTEFLKAVFTPLALGKVEIWNLDNEKWIPLGTSMSILALFGFLGLKKIPKILILASGLLVTLIALNNISPIYQFLIKQDWYVLSRVSTRVWFIPVLFTTFLAGYGFDLLIKKQKSKAATDMIAFFVIAELVTLSWLRLLKPIPEQTKFAPAGVYEFLASDKEKFRVFCLNRCLSQKEAVVYGLELVEGYNTLQQKNYYDQFIQLSQVFWEKYTLALPPFEIYHFREIQPYSPEIAGYNVKYVISPHPLKDKNLTLKKEMGNYLIYENRIVKSRAYFSNGKDAPIMEYSPNYIKVDTSLHKTKQLIVAEVYNSGWMARLNGEKPTEIKQTPNKLRQVEIEKDTRFVEMHYNPKSYRLGRVISLLTLLSLALFFLVPLLRRKKGLKRARK